MKNTEIHPIAEYWRKKYSSQINNDPPFEVREHFRQMGALFAPGSCYYYVMNFHNLNLEYISEGVENFIDLPVDEVQIFDLLNLALPDEVEGLKKKESLIQDFMMRYLDPEKKMEYKVQYSYKMKDSWGNQKLMLHQATPLSLTDGEIQHVFSLHTDISHLKAHSSAEVSFINTKGGRSYYNLNSSTGIFDPQDESLDLNFSEKFSPREKMIINGLAKGLSADEISEKDNLSIHTVKTHRKNILKKSGCRNTPELIARCVVSGVVTAA